MRCAFRMEHWVVGIAAACAAASLSACKTVPVVPPAPMVTWEEKLAWMTRLEDQRLVRDPNPPPPAVIRPATRREPALIGPPAPSDLIALLDDPEARVRRRAALALGRVGLTAAVEPLTRRLTDEEPEVRQMAAFALGLIGDAAARTALLSALSDREPIVQGRAAEALALIGDKSDAGAIAGMTRAHIMAGALNGIEPDDLTYPLAPPIEAVRLGLYALARLGVYDPLASTVLGPDGQPVSRWWPVAYALQRVNDPKTGPTLLTLVTTPGRYTASFAAKGLAAQKTPAGTTALRQIVEQRRAPAAVSIQAIRGLAAAGDASAAALLLRISRDESVDAAVRAEAMTAFGAVAGSEAVEDLQDLLSDPSPAIRATAAPALARVDSDAFMATLAGLEPDRDWTVRAALARALGTVPAEQGLPLLTNMLQDRDPRVVPAVLEALVKANAPGADRLALEKLKADDFVVRGAAATALADLKVVSAFPALEEAYREALNDTTYVARGAILAALNRLNPEAARPRLQEALHDRDWALRVRALELLRQQNVPDASPDTIRPATLGRPIDSPEWKAIVAPQYSPHTFIETDKGTIEIELAIQDAPLTVDNFMQLARKGFFDGIAVHRVVPDFVVQDGDPRGDGEGGPGYTIRDEINQRPYLRGTVGMALDWEDTGGSQFFITHSPQPHLDARYTVFGFVVNGMEVVDRIAPWDIVRRVTIWDGVTPR